MRESERPRRPKASLAEREFFRGLGRANAQLPPVSPPPPRTGTQVIEEMDRIRRLAKPPADVEVRGDLDSHLNMIATFKAKAKMDPDCLSTWMR